MAAATQASAAKQSATTKYPALSAEKAKEIDEKMHGSDWFKKRPEHIKDLFRKMPPYGFYRNKETQRPCRIIGFHEIEDKKRGTTKIHAQTIVPLWPIFNYTPGGRLVEELERIDNWSQTDIDYITLMFGEEVASQFFEPMGFVNFTS